MNYPALTPTLPFDWPDIAAIPIAETNAPLHILQPAPRLRLRPIYHEMGIAHALPHIILRAPLIERLHQALATLPERYGFEILDGWRPIAVQHALRENFRADIIARHPEYNAAQIDAKLDQFVANPERRNMTPPHHTGGSIDLTLFDTENGHTLDMGTAFDEPSQRSHSAALENEAPTPAREHRRILIHTLLRAGFTNLPSEWWHFDYGNQNWAYFNGAPAAHFGSREWQT